MNEVTLVKRFCILALVALVVLGTAACTREKPAEPTSTTVVSQNVAGTPSTSFSGTPVGTSVAPIATTVSMPSTTPVTVVPVATVAATATPLPPTAVPTASSNPGTYTVQWGDWLNKIASQLGVTTQALIAANPGINANLIYPGQVLNVPGSTTTVPATSTPTTPSTPPSNPSTYTVQRGDWIYAIARKFGVSVAALLAANPGIHPNFVFPGQVLSIPGGTTPPDSPPPSGNTYTVQLGDTLFSIAVRFKTTTYALQIKNNLANPNFIYPGQVLTLPQ